MRAQTSTRRRRAARYDPESMMRRRPSVVLLALAVALALAPSPATTAPAAPRAVAVTFDDLPGPGGSLLSSDVPALRENTRKLLAAFLAGRGYTVTPVTIDNDEYVYAAAYADARRRGDTPMATRLAEDYLRYMESVFSFIEGVSRDLLGREIPQVLLLHANALNADRFPQLAAMMRARGYRFVALEEALRDKAYGRPDTYVGPWGVSWLHHWEITEGRKRSPSPDPPEWVTKAYEAAAR